MYISTDKYRLHLYKSFYNYHLSFHRLSFVYFIFYLLSFKLDFLGILFRRLTFRGILLFSWERPPWISKGVRPRPPRPSYLPISLHNTNLFFLIFTQGIKTFKRDMRDTPHLAIEAFIFHINLTLISNFTYCLKAPNRTDGPNF